MDTLYYGNNFMKTTLEIPDKTFRKAKARAAQQGIPLCEFVTKAVERELETSASRANGEPPWMKHIGKLKHLKKELEEFDRIIEVEFEQIDPEMWK